MDNKGSIFSFQGTFALTIMLLIGLIAVFAINNFSHKTIENETNTEFERKAIFLADSMVKNHNEENPILGSAIFDSSLQRVKANTIDLDRLKTATLDQSFIAQIAVKKITAKGENKVETIFETPKENFSKCLNVQRAITNLKNDSIELLEVTVCE